MGSDGGSGARLRTFDMMGSVVCILISGDDVSEMRMTGPRFPCSLCISLFFVRGVLFSRVVNASACGSVVW